MDLRDGAADEGSYVENGRLKHSDGPPSAPNTYVQVVYTRDGSQESQRAYVDGQLAVDASVVDDSDLGLQGASMRFFRDDVEFPNEASAGAVARIRVYDGPLTASEVDLTVLEHWTSGTSGVRYPIAWRIEARAAGLTLDVRPYLPNQELDLSVRYWEGAVRAAGQGPSGALTGQGYLELAGY